MAEFNPNTQQKEPTMTIVRGKTQLKLFLEAGMIISQHQPLEVVLTVLPEELANHESESQRGPAANSCESS